MRQIKGYHRPRNTAGFGIAPPVQPYPKFTQAAEKHIAGQTLTAIHRRWHPGQSRHCRLCPTGQCTAHEDSCLILTSEQVGNGREIALYRVPDIGADVGRAVPLAPGHVPAIRIYEPTVHRWTLDDGGIEVLDPQMLLKTRKQ